MFDLSNMFWFFISTGGGYPPASVYGLERLA
jgi:hypothetical protein